MYYLDEGYDEMYRDIAPNLPKVVIINVPEGLIDFQNRINALEILGIEIEVATAEILDHFRIKDEGLYSLQASSNDMLSDQTLISELADDVLVYVSARQKYGEELYKEIVQHGLYVNGVLYYQLKKLDSTMLVLEKLLVPLTEHELRDRNLTRQADITSRRWLLGINAFST